MTRIRDRGKRKGPHRGGTGIHLPPVRYARFNMDAIPAEAVARYAAVVWDAMRATASGRS